MKNTLYIILIFTIIFSACKKEESNSNTTSGDIIGTWSMTNFTSREADGYYTDYPNGKYYDYDTTVNMTIPGSIGDLTLTAWYVNFNDDGTVITTQILDDNDVQIDTSTYLKQGDNLIIDEEELVTITKLTSTNLTIEMSYSDTSHNYMNSLGHIHFWEQEATHQFTRE